MKKFIFVLASLTILASSTVFARGEIKDPNPKKEEPIVIVIPNGVLTYQYKSSYTAKAFLVLSTTKTGVEATLKSQDPEERQKAAALMTHLKANLRNAKSRIFETKQDVVLVTTGLRCCAKDSDIKAVLEEVQKVLDPVVKDLGIIFSKSVQIAN